MGRKKRAGGKKRKRKSWNEKTGVKSYNKVTQLFVRKTDLIYKLTFSSGTTVETTWNHPFWVSSTGTSTDSTGSPTTGSVSDISSLQAGKWIEAKDLQIGDESILQDGRLTQIQSIEQVHVAPTKVYNIEMEDFHTYFVGEDGVWVHNYEQVSRYGDSGFFSNVGQRVSNLFSGNGFKTNQSLIKEAAANHGLAGELQMAQNLGYSLSANEQSYANASSMRSILLEKAKSGKLTVDERTTLSTLNDRVNSVEFLNSNSFARSHDGANTTTLTPFYRNILSEQFPNQNMDNVMVVNRGSVIASVVSTFNPRVRALAPPWGNTIYHAQGGFYQDSTGVSSQSGAYLLGHEVSHLANGFSESRATNEGFRTQRRAEYYRNISPAYQQEYNNLRGGR